MGEFSQELRRLGYERTERTSPFDDCGELWTNSYELVCDETARVIRKGEGFTDTDDDESEANSETVYRYRNTERVKLYGGFVSSYDWGDDGDEFSY